MARPGMNPEELSAIAGPDANKMFLNLMSQSDVGEGPSGLVAPTNVGAGLHNIGAYFNQSMRDRAKAAERKDMMAAFGGAASANQAATSGLFAKASAPSFATGLNSSAPAQPSAAPMASLPQAAPQKTPLAPTSDSVMGPVDAPSPAPKAPSFATGLKSVPDTGAMPSGAPMASPYIDKMKQFEGYTPRAQWDYKQHTNGYGTRAQAPGEVIDRATAEQRFNDEIGKASTAVNGFAPNAPDGVKAALTDLTFNAGNKWMGAGLGQLVKAGDYDGAQQRFLQYNKAGGQTLPGLVNRRKEGAAWFKQPSSGMQVADASGATVPGGSPMASPPPMAGGTAPGINSRQVQSVPVPRGFAGQALPSPQAPAQAPQQPTQQGERYQDYVARVNAIRANPDYARMSPQEQQRLEKIIESQNPMITQQAQTQQQTAGVDLQLKQAELEKMKRWPQPQIENVNGRLVQITPNGAKEIYSSPTAGQKDPPAGYQWDPSKPGALMKIPGGPAEFRNFSEVQTKDAGFAARMLRAEDNINAVAGIDENGKPLKGAYDPTRSANAYFPDEPSISNLWTANMVNSQEWQSYIQAARESMAALLRKDTGAAISDQEFSLYFPMYYPQPGDGPDVVKQKKAARAEIARGLATGSGGAFDHSYPDRAKILSGGSAPQGNNAQPPQQQIPSRAVEALRANPDLAADFDAKYGAGAAAKVMGGR